ncbi:MAG: hypothetical protein HOP03_09170 [Lysobacter sp.]|nr:hypothetical protein [Lysobacter sp.]
MILAAWPSYDSWHERWRVEVLAQTPGEAPKWKQLPYIERNNHRYAPFFNDLEEARAWCAELNANAIQFIDSELDPIRRLSLRLKADKSLQAKKRLAEEEQLMLVEAKRRQSDKQFVESDFFLNEKSERFRERIIAELNEFPYLNLVLIREEGRHFFFFKMKDGSWSSPQMPNRKEVLGANRSKIANGFDFSGLAHWGKTKAEIRKILLPRANELLQRAGIKRMLAEALVQGKRVLVWGSYVFWYESHNSPGWIVKERSSGADGTDGEAMWREGTICSKNHGRIVVLPYIKEDGVRVTGHTKNAPHDGPALPRHPDDIIEIPFEELDGDLMIGLLGELPYE